MGIFGWFGKTGAPPQHENALEEMDLSKRTQRPFTRPSRDPKQSADGSAAEKRARPTASSFLSQQNKQRVSTSSLNQKIVQAAEFTNQQVADQAHMLATAPANIIAAQNSGLAVQDAQNYMNAIMQIAVAAQAVAIKKAAEGPEPSSDLKQIPLMHDIQNMVTQAVKVFETVKQ